MERPGMDEKRAAESTFDKPVNIYEAFKFVDAAARSRSGVRNRV